VNDVISIPLSDTPPVLTPAPAPASVAPAIPPPTANGLAAAPYSFFGANVCPVHFETNCPACASLTPAERLLAQHRVNPIAPTAPTAPAEVEFRPEPVRPTEPDTPLVAAAKEVALAESELKKLDVERRDLTEKLQRNGELRSEASNRISIARATMSKLLTEE
jgi:hypothetical protein